MASNHLKAGHWRVVVYLMTINSNFNVTELKQFVLYIKLPRLGSKGKLPYTLKQTQIVIKPPYARHYCLEPDSIIFTQNYCICKQR